MFEVGEANPQRHALKVVQRGLVSALTAPKKYRFGPFPVPYMGTEMGSLGLEGGCRGRWGGRPPGVLKRLCK